MRFSKLIIPYEENTNVNRIVRTDEEIKKDFSTRKFKISKGFIDYVNQFEHLWKDERFISDYIITPLKNDITNFEYLKQPSSEHTALFINMTQSFIIDKLWRMCNNHNVIMTLHGDTGSGKSTFALDDCWLINDFVHKVLGKDVKFVKDNIAFSRSEVVEIVPRLKNYECVLMDEDNEAVLGVGSFQQWNQVNRFEKTLRSMSKNFYNCSPDLRTHNEHYIVQCKGVNDSLFTNKAIFRERTGVWNGFVLSQMFKSNKYKKLVKGYESKKKKFQKDLEQNRGDDKRLKRMLDMCVDLIKRHELTLKMKGVFTSIINAEFKVSIESGKEIKRLMELLLDSRVEIFKEWKEEVRDFIIPLNKKK